MRIIFFVPVVASAFGLQKNMIDWKKEKPVFDTLLWAVQAVNGFKTHIWAPNISYHNGLYYLYYSVSAFGKQNT